ELPDREVSRSVLRDSGPVDHQLQIRPAVGQPARGRAGDPDHRDARDPGPRRREPPRQLCSRPVVLPAHAGDPPRSDCADRRPRAGSLVGRRYRMWLFATAALAKEPIWTYSKYDITDKNLFEFEDVKATYSATLADWYDQYLARTDKTAPTV